VSLVRRFRFRVRGTGTGDGDCGGDDVGGRGLLKGEEIDSVILSAIVLKDAIVNCKIVRIVLLLLLLLLMHCFGWGDR